ncbi:MAG TPA: T9SS type A sorting domain-containing protein, partial [Chryseolinea sp.]|nr:T9SS type A sorting domain-containing protein [Chryseolinea sp.]
GNNNVTSIGGHVGWTTFSDGRYKKDIHENVQGLSFINSLRPITYSVNVKGLNEYYDKIRRSSGARDNLSERKGDVAKSELEASAEAAAKIVYTGFVAQEVELAAKKLNFEFSGVDKPANDDGLYGLRYDNFISPLVKAVQELSAKNNEKDSLINDLQYQVDEKDSLISDLQTQFNDLKSLLTKSINGTPIASAGYLKQNAPNPFNQNTVISYHVADNAGHAQIRITDVTGRLIKAFNATKGDGQIHIRSGQLAAGTYSYTLYVDNKSVDTRQMVMLK